MKGSSITKYGCAYHDTFTTESRGKYHGLFSVYRLYLMKIGIAVHAVETFDALFIPRTIVRSACFVRMLSRTTRYHPVAINCTVFRLEHVSNLRKPTKTYSTSVMEFRIFSHSQNLLLTCLKPELNISHCSRATFIFKCNNISYFYPRIRGT